MKILVSIVIPTHNRFKYARYAITSILSIASYELELVVHDTSTNAELKDWIKNRTTDQRLVYIHTDESLSMTENCNRAIALAKGNYVCLIGDDDSVCHTIINAAKLALKNNIDALTPMLIVNYAWPDFKTRFFNHAGKMYLKKFTGNTTYPIISKSIKKVINNCFQGVGDLPKVYHGLILLSRLKELKAQTGQYFFGVSPDMSGAIGISQFIKNHCIIDYPIIMPGASGGSNTGRSALNKHKGKLEEDQHMKPFKNEYWPPEIPRIFSVETVWAQAALVTLKKLNNNYLLQKFNVIKFHALCYFKHKDFSTEIKNNMVAHFNTNKLTPFTNWMLFYYFVFTYRLNQFKYLAWRAIIPTASRGKKTFSNIKTILEATETFKIYFEGLKKKIIYSQDRK